MRVLVTRPRNFLFGAGAGGLGAGGSGLEHWRLFSAVAGFVCVSFACSGSRLWPGASAICLLELVVLGGLRILVAWYGAHRMRRDPSFEGDGDRAHRRGQVEVMGTRHGQVANQSVAKSPGWRMF